MNFVLTKFVCNVLNTVSGLYFKVLKIPYFIRQLGSRQWEAYICMEEPFDRTNAGRAIIRRERFDEILSAFKAADKIMRKGGSLTKLLNRSLQ